MNEKVLKCLYDIKFAIEEIDSYFVQVNKTFEESKAEISNDLQQSKFKDTEKAYVESLRQKYPVKINEEVLAEAFKE